MGTTRRAMARRLGVIAAGVVLVSGTFTGAALAQGGSGGGSGSGSGSDPVSNTVNSVVQGGTSTINNTYSVVNNTVNGVTSIPGQVTGGLTGDGTNNPDFATTDTASNSEACDALTGQYDVQIQQIRNTAAQLNNPNLSQAEMNTLIAQLNMQRRQARSVEQTLNQLGCGTSTTEPDVGTIITNPCVVINDGDNDGYRRRRTRSADATCTYNRNGNGITTDTTTPTTLTTLSALPAAATSLPQSQITGNAVPTGGVNTGGFSEGP